MSISRIRKLCAFLLCTILIGSLSSAPSSFTKNLFTLEGKSVQSVAINQSFTENAQVDVVKAEAIACAVPSVVYGASVDANIELLNEASLVRMVLIDADGNEYMIYEINSLLAENTSFSIADACHETKLLNGVNAVSMRVDVLAATVNVQNASFVTEAPVTRSEISALQRQIKENQHQARIDLYNKMIKLKGERWVAGPTEISMKSYQEKKCYYLGGAANPLPNTQGTEFYAGGVMPGRTNTPPVEMDMPRASMFVDTFDWRNRHGATKSSSPYYNDANYGSVNGWASRIKNQGNCGSCYIFASVGEAETKFHLYYNDHLQIDLAEQFVGSCSDRYAGRMCSGGMPRYVSDFMVDEGIIDEESFEYTASNYTNCRDSANNPEDHCFFDSYKNLKNNEVEDWEDFKMALIKYGPNAGADLSISHAMTVVGYRQDGNDLTIIYKNSWGGSGDKGYMYRESPWSNSSWAVFDMTTPNAIVSDIYDDSDIRCVDLDNDGYYNWGIGPKPETCPNGCPDERDCDDSDPEFGPYIEENGVWTGECEEITVDIIPAKSSNAGINHHCVYDPVQRATIINFEAPHTAKASVGIYRMSGGLVKTLDVNQTENSVMKAVWNRSSAPVSKGIYLCKISVDNAGTVTTSSFKIAVLR